MDNLEQPNVGAYEGLIQVQFSPLALILTTADAKSFCLFITPAAAQELALTLLGAPGVGFTPLPELLESVARVDRYRAVKDSEFLKKLGVSSG